MNEKYLSGEASMCFPIKQMVLRRIMGLKHPQLPRPYLDGFINASSITVFNLVADRNELGKITEVPRQYQYLQVTSRTNGLRSNELKTITAKLVSNTGDCIVDCGIDDGLDDNMLSVFAVSYSGTSFIRKRKELVNDADEMERLLFKGRELVHGYANDEHGLAIIDFEQGYLALSEAADMGSAEAQFEMGVRYAEGIACEKNPDKANRYLLMAASSTDARWSCAAMIYAIKEGIQLNVE